MSLKTAGEIITLVAGLANVGESLAHALKKPPDVTEAIYWGIVGLICLLVCAALFFHKPAKDESPGMNAFASDGGVATNTKGEGNTVSVNIEGRRNG